MVMENRIDCIISTPTKCYHVYFTYEEFKEYRKKHPQSIIAPSFKKWLQ